MESCGERAWRVERVAVVTKVGSNFTGDKSLVNPNLISKFKISTFFN